MTNPELYSGIEMIMQANLVGAIKIGVESVSESVVSKYSIHNMKDKTANNEMFIPVNGPKVGKEDETIKKTWDRKFGGRGGWHFWTKQNLFRTGGITVKKI